MEKLSALSHLFMTFFLYNFSTFMVVPAMTDVTMSALCPGEVKCSLAIYMSGFQHTVTFCNSSLLSSQQLFLVFILVHIFPNTQIKFSTLCEPKCMH